MNTEPSTAAQIAAARVGERRARAEQALQAQSSEARKKTYLKRVEDATRILEKAKAHHADAIEEALAAGVLQEDVVQVTGMSRVTLWRHRRARAAATAGPVTATRSELDAAPPP